MAIHDFKCPKCGEMVEDLVLTLAETEFVQWCVQCNTPMEQIFKGDVIRKPFKHYWDQHMSEDGPVEITSERQRQKELKKRGMDYFSYGMGNPGCEV